MNKNNDFNFDFPKGMKYSGRSFREICETAQEEFYNGNGYYPTTEEAVKLTKEAREEIEKLKEK